MERSIIDDGAESVSGHTDKHRSSRQHQNLIQEGNIWKWVNYYHSWKERYFLVEPGIIKYSVFKGDVRESTVLLNSSSKVRMCPGDVNRLEVEHSLGVLYLKFDSEKDKKIWAEAICRSRTMFVSGKLNSLGPMLNFTPHSSVPQKPYVFTQGPALSSVHASSSMASNFHTNDDADQQDEANLHLLQTLLERCIHTREQFQGVNAEVRVAQQKLIQAAAVVRDSQFRDDIKRIVLRLVELLDHSRVVVETQLSVTENLVTLESQQRKKLERSIKNLARQNYEMETQIAQGVKSGTVSDAALVIPNFVSGRSSAYESTSVQSTIDIFDRQEPPSGLMSEQAPLREKSSSQEILDGSESSEEFFDADDEERADLFSKGPPNESFGVIQRRTALPCPRKEFKIRLWSLLKGCIGQDLSRVSMPVYFNEPTSLLQRLVEDNQYDWLLTKASKEPRSVDRLLWVTIFSMSPYSSAVGRTYKPFNPLLGETSEFSHRGFRFIAEQVGHHPPVSAYYTEADDYVTWGSMTVINKFTGKSLEILMPGTVHVYLPTTPFKDHFTHGKGKMLINNVIFGRLMIELCGFVTVVNHITGDYAILEYLRKGWFDTERHAIKGIVFDHNGVAIYRIGGSWSRDIWVEDCILPKDYVSTDPECKASDCPLFKLKNDSHKSPKGAGLIVPGFDSTDELTLYSAETSQTGASPNPPCGHSNCGEVGQDATPHSAACRGLACLQVKPPSVAAVSHIESNWDAAYESDPNSRRVVWQPDPRPPTSSEYYDFGYLTFELNEISKEYDVTQGSNMPPTDSRFRPDQRVYENGDVELAHSEKLRIEELQRERARERSNGETDYEPMWFYRGKSSITGEPSWLYNGKYWDAKSVKDGFAKCPKIFE